MANHVHKPPGRIESVGGIDVCPYDSSEDRSQAELDFGQPMQENLNLEGGDPISRSAAALRRI